MNFEEIKKDLLNDIESSGSLLRIFMSSEQIKAANQLVKEGKLLCGTNPGKHGTKMYYIKR